MKTYHSFRVGFDDDGVFITCYGTGDVVEQIIRMGPFQATYLSNELIERFEEYVYDKKRQGIEV